MCGIAGKDYYQKMTIEYGVLTINVDWGVTMRLSVLRNQDNEESKRARKKGRRSESFMSIY